VAIRLALVHEFRTRSKVLVCTEAGAKGLNLQFCETVINILRSHPQAIYLLIGEGELSTQKRKFESAGVAKRVGYAGRRKDLPGFLRMTDIYLSEFPCGTGMGALQAMCMERPCVAVRGGKDDAQSQAAQFVGNEACVSGDDPNDYIERVSKLIREPQYRARLGKSMRTRVDSARSPMSSLR
jgi:glycosyltransferase involved in cell wall biosynthesis